jgi:hypothetical protein
MYVYNNANTQTLQVCVGGFWTNFEGGGGSVPVATVATLPASPTGNPTYLVTDGQTSADCTVGGGSQKSLCVWFGSPQGWVTASFAGGGTVISFLGFDSSGGQLTNAAIGNPLELLLGEVALTVTGDASGADVVAVTSTSGGTPLTVTTSDVDDQVEPSGIVANVSENDSTGGGADILGIESVVTLSGSNVTHDTIAGVSATVNNGGTGTAGSMIGVESTVNNNGHTATNLFGFYVPEPALGTVAEVAAAYKADSGWPYFLYDADISSRALIPNLQVPPTVTDPTCVTSGDIGKFWFDNTTSTTVVKVCKSVAATIGWSVLTTTP